MNLRKAQSWVGMEGSGMASLMPCTLGVCLFKAQDGFTPGLGECSELRTAHVVDLQMT